MLYTTLKTGLSFSGLLILLLLLATGCSDFFEEDLAEKNVQLQSPTDNLETKDTNVNFWWKIVLLS